MSQENFLVHLVTGSTYPELVFELCTYQIYIQNFEMNWKNSFSIRLDNFAKSVNF